MEPIQLVVFGAATLMALVALPRTAFPCSFVGNSSFNVTERDDAEGEAPGEVSIEVQSITRGKGASGNIFTGYSASSCDDIGTFRVALDGMEADVGYRFEVTEGSFEGHMRDEPVRPPGCSPDASSCDDSEFLFTWIDGAHDDQEPLGFRLQVTPVDRQGREGPSSSVRVEHPGSGGGCGGCGQTGGGPVPGGLLFVAIAGLGRLTSRYST